MDSDRLNGINDGINIPNLRKFNWTVIIESNSNG